MSLGQIFLIPSYLDPGVPASTVFPEENLTIIKTLDYFLVENIRSARRFISSLKLGVSIEDLEFVELSKNTPDPQVLSMMKPILEGKSAGIISEAGIPGVADPGSKVVLEAHKKGIRVRPLTGPSSLFLALMASGLNGQGFTFHGYLPIDKNKRAMAIKSLERDSQQSGKSQMFMETPYRNNPLFEAILSTCDDATYLSLSVELTGKNEIIDTRQIREWKENKPDLHKRPCIFIIQR